MIRNDQCCIARKLLMEKVGHIDNLYGRPLLLKFSNVLDMTTIATKTDIAFGRAPITCVQISGQLYW